MQARPAKRDEIVCDVVLPDLCVGLPYGLIEISLGLSDGIAADVAKVLEAGRIAEQEGDGIGAGDIEMVCDAFDCTSATTSTFNAAAKRSPGWSQDPSRWRVCFAEVESARKVQASVFASS